MASCVSEHAAGGQPPSACCSQVGAASYQRGALLLPQPVHVHTLERLQAAAASCSLYVPRPCSSPLWPDPRAAAAAACAVQEYYRAVAAAMSDGYDQPRRGRSPEHARCLARAPAPPVPGRAGRRGQRTSPQRLRCASPCRSSPLLLLLRLPACSQFTPQLGSQASAYADAAAGCRPPCVCVPAGSAAALGLRARAPSPPPTSSSCAGCPSPPLPTTWWRSLTTSSWASPPSPASSELSVGLSLLHSLMYKNEVDVGDCVGWQMAFFEIGSWVFPASTQSSG